MTRPLSPGTFTRLAAQLEADNTSLRVERATHPGGKRVWRVQLDFHCFGEDILLPLAYMKAFLKLQTQVNVQLNAIQGLPEERVRRLLDRARTEARKLFGRSVRHAARQATEIETLLALAAQTFASHGAPLGTSVLLPPDQEPHPACRFDFGVLGSTPSALSAPVTPDEADWFPRVPERLRIRWGTIRRLVGRDFVAYKTQQDPRKLTNTLRIWLAPDILARFGFLYEEIQRNRRP